jgi:hypothetical protein
MLLALTCAVLTLAAAPFAVAISIVSGPLTGASVTPTIGSPRTSFTVSLRNPSLTGITTEWRRWDTIGVLGPQHSGCVSSATATMPGARLHARVRTKLNPARFGGRWCVGTFRGTIFANQRLVCGPERVCPLLEIAPRQIARFTFRVTTTS